MLSRRLLLAAAALPAAPRILNAAEPLVLWGPPAAPALVLLRAVADGSLRDIAPEVSFRAWRNPDEMRAGIGSGTMGALVVPSYVAANLHNRGLGLRLVNVLTDGLLAIVAPPGQVKDIAGLRGKRVAVPFRNDMPDLVLRRLLAGAGMTTRDLSIDYSGTAIEAVQMMVLGRAEAALLSEPATTGAVMRAAGFGRPLERAVDTRLAWQALTGRAALPQAGLIVTDRLAARIGTAGIERIQRALEAALVATLADPEAAAQQAASLFGMPAEVVAASIPHSNLVVRPARAAREDLETLYRSLVEEDARLVGGRLPGDAFYAL
jgi:NitT/TauT family transport system substrate-binding protein